MRRRSATAVRAVGAANPEHLRRGRSLFVKHCVTCHGDLGRGDGRHENDEEIPADDEPVEAPAEHRPHDAEDDDGAHRGGDEGAKDEGVDPTRADGLGLLRHRDEGRLGDHRAGAQIGQQNIGSDSSSKLP